MKNENLYRILLALLLSASLHTDALAQPHSITTPQARLPTTPHIGQSGSYVLEKGEQSLLARAWLTQRATRSIDVQYFIWSTDNVGILAAEALLQAADRGVSIRVLVDDFLIDAEERTLLTLAAHPKIHIRVYNPRHQVGVSAFKRWINLFIGFRQSNQRMHDKVFIVDKQTAITGGRNMADEYFDFDHHYNFRDRDVLLSGEVVNAMNQSFEQFWQHELSVPVETLLADELKKLDSVTINTAYTELHSYAAKPENFAPQVRQALTDMDQPMQQMLHQLHWGKVQFVNDIPGKNPNRFDLGGGGRSTSALKHLLLQAKQSITIQSPYLIMPEGGMELFKTLLDKKIIIRISTNSLASTDNLYAFSGYLAQREQLLDLGLKIFEYNPFPHVAKQLLRPEQQEKPPVFAIHAKTMVIDHQTLYIGTFNFDPRSSNLNTEVGVIIHHPGLAQQVEQAIETDMLPENSWSAHDNPDQHSPWWKRVKARFFSWLPLNPVL
ncbi:MAG: phospholipase D family protein [Gammaproteobacteria bacterium]|nr:phospholipase D family protein [Gammaproteobacteria bacterium]MDH5801903.1 phospholipase D family protein [Gammaproteobacteria bacterium]